MLCSSVEGGMRSLAAAPDGPATRPRLSASAASMISRSLGGSPFSTGCTRRDKPLRIVLVHIGVNGPRLRPEVARLAKDERADLVVCGHSHVPFIGVDKGLTVFNPGSIGPRRFSLPIVLGTIDIAPGGVRLAHVDVETGHAWVPPPMGTA